MPVLAIGIMGGLASWLGWQEGAKYGELATAAKWAALGVGVFVVARYAGVIK